jgi:hypothetical protein
VNERLFAYNNRSDSDLARMNKALANVSRGHLSYAALTGKKTSEDPDKSDRTFLLSPNLLFGTAGRRRWTGTQSCDNRFTGRVLPFRVMAPSTLGTFLRAFTFGHVRQLDAVIAEAIRRAWSLAGLEPRR